jgi:hypothetical protein
LLDIGTEALPDSINKLYKLMKNNDNIGGCCGDMELDISDGFNLLTYA